MSFRSTGAGLDSFKSLRPATFSISKEELKHEYVIRHQYDPQNHLYNLMSFKGTALAFVLTAKTFWVLVTFNSMVFTGWHYLSNERKEIVKEHWSLQSGYISSLGSLVVFTIVFYTGNCYVVYKDLFHIGCKVSRRMVHLAMHLKSVFRSGEDVWASIRHMIAAQRVFYYELKKQMAEYHQDGPGAEAHPGAWDDWAYKHLVLPQLIKPEEAELLKNFEGKKVPLLSGWAQTSFIEHSKANEFYLSLPPPLQSQFLRVTMTENETLQELLCATSDTKQFGVPFVYHHIVHLLVLCYLILLSFNNLFIDTSHNISYWSLITYPVVVFVMQGILAAADAMADPFGDDDCDFNLEALTIITYNDCATLVDYVNADEPLMDRIATKFTGKPKLPPKISKVNGDSKMASSPPAVSGVFLPPLALPKPQDKRSELTHGEVNPEEAGASVKMMAVMVESVKMLAQQNKAQAEMLASWESKMEEMMAEVKAELEAATRKDKDRSAPRAASVTRASSAMSARSRDRGKTFSARSDATASPVLSAYHRRSAYQAAGAPAQPSDVAVDLHSDGDDDDIGGPYVAML